MNRLPPSSTRMTHSFPPRRSSDLAEAHHAGDDRSELLSRRALEARRHRHEQAVRRHRHRVAHAGGGLHEAVEQPADAAYILPQPVVAHRTPSSASLSSLSLFTSPPLASARPRSTPDRTPDRKDEPTRGLARGAPPARDRTF